jgi:DNA-binding transcriptional MerR regulator
MEKKFFTGKQAAQIVGCTPRQLQYWRDRGIVIPAIAKTGTGRSVYYSRSDLLALAVIEYCLFAGLDFDSSAMTVKLLRKKEPEFTTSLGRFMLRWDSKARSLKFVEWDMESAIDAMKAGEPVIPIWLDRIDGRVASRLGCSP